MNQENLTEKRKNLISSLILEIFSLKEYQKGNIILNIIFLIYIYFLNFIL